MNAQILYTNEFKIKANWYAVVFLTFWLAADFFALSFLGYGFFFYPGRIGDVWPFWIIFFAFGIFGLNIVLWNLRGKEVIMVTEKGITIKKTGGLLANVNNVSIHELEGVEYDNDDTRSSRAKYWRIGGGKIIVKYLGTEKRVGQNLDLIAAERITKEIRNALEKLTHDA